MNLTTLIILGICVAIIALFTRKQKKQHVEVFLDISGSMPIDNATEAIVTMMGEMRDDIKVSFSTFSMTVHKRVDFNTPLEAAVCLHDKPFVMDLIGAAGGGTDYTCIPKALTVPYDYVFVITDEAEDCKAKIGETPNIVIHSCVDEK